MAWFFWAPVDFVSGLALGLVLSGRGTPLRSVRCVRCAQSCLRPDVCAPSQLAVLRRQLVFVEQLGRMGAIEEEEQEALGELLEEKLQRWA